MLEEVCKTVLVRGFLDSSYVGREIEFCPAGRIFVVHDIISHAVVQLAFSDCRIVRKLLHLGIRRESER